MTNRRAVFVLGVILVQGCRLLATESTSQPNAEVSKNVPRAQVWEALRDAFERSTEGLGGNQAQEPRRITARRVEEYGFGYTCEYQSSRLQPTFQFRQIARSTNESYPSIGGTTHRVVMYGDSGFKLDLIYFGRDQQAAEMFSEALTVLAYKDRRGIK